MFDCENPTKMINGLSFPQDHRQCRRGQDVLGEQSSGPRKYAWAGWSPAEDEPEPEA